MAWICSISVMVNRFDMRKHWKDEHTSHLKEKASVSKCTIRRPSYTAVWWISSKARIHRAGKRTEDLGSEVSFLDRVRRKLDATRQNAEKEGQPRRLYARWQCILAILNDPLIKEGKQSSAKFLVGHERRVEGVDARLVNTPVPTVPMLGAGIPSLVR